MEVVKPYIPINKIRIVTAASLFDGHDAAINIMPNPDKVKEQLNLLQEAAVKNENLFKRLMEASKFCSLGQITNALFAVGGQYRRNM